MSDAQDKNPTWWAPIRHQPVYCCCHAPDAHECARIRYNRPFPVGDDFWRPEDDLYEACDCCCHDREWDEFDECEIWGIK